MDTRQRFLTPGRREAFSGITNLLREDRRRRRRDVVRDLEGIDAYTLKREIKRPRVYNPYMVWEPRKLFQIDLIDFFADKGMVQRNGGHRYLMCVIDSFTRYLWVKPLKRKNQVVVTAAYRELSRQFGRQPQRLLCDAGGEFVSDRFRALLGSLGTVFIVKNGKAGTVERVQRSLQRLIYTFITATGDKRFIDRLPALLRTYNTRRHRIIKMSPAEAEEEENLNTVRDNVREYYAKALAKRQRPRFKLGDKVRVKIRRQSFTRGYQNQFTDRVYVVTSINAVLPRPMFSVAPLSEAQEEEFFRRNEGDEVAEYGRDTYYAEELQRVSGRAFRNPRLILSERGPDGERRHRVEVSVGKDTREEGWFTDREFETMQQR